MNFIKIFFAIILLTVPADSRAQGFMSKLTKFAGRADSMAVQAPDGHYYIEGDGVMYMADGTVVPGIIRFGFVSQSCIDFHPATEMKMKTYCSNKIDHFTIGNKKFYAVTFKESSFTIGHEKVFMERLNDNDSDRFRMFYIRHEVRNTDQQFQSGQWKLDHGYYVLLPDMEKAYDIEDTRFMPFAKKMSALLQDCPDLSKKIADKEAGYKISVFAGGGNDEVYLRIMREYNACAKVPVTDK